MNLMYLGIINFNKKNQGGVAKKINGQSKAFKKHFIEFHKMYLSNDGLEVMYNNKKTILKHSKVSKYEFIKKRIIYYKVILNYIKKEKIEMLYIRYPMSDPFFINFLKECKIRGIRIFLEIPTYPYDDELDNLTIKVDKYFRKFLYKYVEKIITYSKDKTIYKLPTICIENGVDIEELKQINRRKKEDTINIIGVATLAPWHGYDRIIEGLHKYYKEVSCIINLAT